MFSTRANFDGDEALVPLNVIKSIAMKVKINSVSKMVVHFVGNKAKGNGVDFGGNLIPVEDIECDIKKLVLKAFDFSDLYHFYFESTVELNPVYTFVRNIFQDSSTFCNNQSI